MKIINLEDILKLFACRNRGCNVDDGGNTLECLGEIALDKVIDDDDVDLVTVLGIRLPQCVSLLRSRNSDEMLMVAINRNVANSPTLERDSPLSTGVTKHAHRRSRTCR